MTAQHQRHILHFDMDAFFAAVEEMDNPDLRGRPLLVGGDPKSRGVVSTANYEARRFGCHSAMPMSKAIRLCPQAAIVQPRMSRYAEISGQVFDIAEQFTPEIEPLSVDEAFLDISGSIRLLGSPVAIAESMKARIRSEVGLTASIGLAPNKFLAKLASDMEKPDGLVVVRPDRIDEFLNPLPIGRLWGVGKATLPKLTALGVETFADLRRFAREDLAQRFGEAGDHFYNLVRGIDNRSVVPDREAKSISHELTFAQDIEDRDYLRSVLLDLTDQVAARLRRHKLTARTVTIKIRTADFSTATRSNTLSTATDQTNLFWTEAGRLFETWCTKNHAAVRLIGMGVSQLSTDFGEQLSLFGQEENQRQRRLDETMDEIRSKFGSDALSRGGSLRKPPK